MKPKKTKEAEEGEDKIGEKEKIEEKRKNMMPEKMGFFSFS